MCGGKIHLFEKAPEFGFAGLAQTLANSQGNNFLCQGWAIPTAVGLIEPRTALRVSPGRSSNPVTDVARIRTSTCKE
jgi:hypothetical protein